MPYLPLLQTGTYYPLESGAEAVVTAPLEAAEAALVMSTTGEAATVAEVIEEPSVMMQSEKVVVESLPTSSAPAIVTAATLCSSELLPQETTPLTPQTEGTATPGIAVSNSLVTVSEFKDVNGAVPPTEKEEQPKMEQTQELSTSYSVQDPKLPSLEKPSNADNIIKGDATTS